MTGSADCRDIRHALGVYVLGAIDPAERSMVDAHLSTCPECREELAGLAGLPALLRRIPVGEAQQLADDDLDELSDAGCLGRGAVGGDAGFAARPHDPGPPGPPVARPGRRRGGGPGGRGRRGSRVERRAPRRGKRPADSAVPANFTSVSATNPATHVAATVRYAARSWGTVLDTRVKNVPAGDRCQLLVTDSSGHTTVVGSWTTTYDEGSVWYPGSSAVTLDSVRSFEVTSQGKVLVRVPAH